MALIWVLLKDTETVMCRKQYFRLIQIHNDCSFDKHDVRDWCRTVYCHSERSEESQFFNLEILLPDESGIRMTFHPCATQTMLWWMFIL
jgi:hypothetical protein